MTGRRATPRGATSDDASSPAASSRAATLQRIVLVALALACAGYGARSLVAIRYASTQGPARLEGLERAATLAPGNWSYDLELGRVLAAFGEHRAAIDRYRRGIANYPACAMCWMGLAEAQATLGEDPTEAILKAVATGRSQTVTRLRAATLYAVLGRDEEAGREFAAAQRGMAEDSDDLYFTLTRLYPAEFLVEHVFSRQDLVAFLGFVLRHRPLADAQVVWARAMRDNVETRDWHRATYAQMLLRNGRTHGAWNVRFAGERPPQAGVLDGSFETASNQFKPFGWHVTQAEGVQAEIAACTRCPDGDRALHLSFDGKHNPRYGGVWQDVPVEPGAAYILTGKAKADLITSASGPRIAVRGIARASSGESDGDDRCGLWAAGPEWIRSLPWTGFRIEFRAPERCDGVRILVARAPTDQFNKFLGGDLWIDDVALAPAAGGD